MLYIFTFFSLALLVILASCSSADDPVAETEQAPESRRLVRIQLDAENPSDSEGILEASGEAQRFPVGFGRLGLACAGTSFQDGLTPLGRFRVNAIFSDSDFAMEVDLVEQSGKSEAELKDSLFRNMSSIDFKGDGQSGDYGIGFHQFGSGPPYGPTISVQHLQGHVPLVQLRHSRHQRQAARRSIGDRWLHQRQPEHVDDFAWHASAW